MKNDNPKLKILDFSLWFFFFIFSFSILLMAAPLLASAEHGGLVPKCGYSQPLLDDLGVKEGKVYYPCDTCHFFDLVKHILDFIWNPIAVVVAALMFTYGGLLMIFPSFGGSVAMYEKGKKTLFSTLIGLMIVFAAWLIIDTIIKVIVANPQFGVLSDKPAQIEGYGPWNSFKCTPLAPIRTSLTPTPRDELPAPALPDQSPTAPMPHLDNATARLKLTEAGVKIVSTSGCSDQKNPNCTSLQGIPEVAVKELLTLQTRLKAECSSCTLVVTGGTEVGHQTHGPGKAVVDISSRSTKVNQFIRRIIGVQAPKINTWYKGGDNHFYFYEGDHWHVCLTSSCAPHKVVNDQIRRL